MSQRDRWGCPVSTDEAETAVIDQAVIEFVTMSPAIVEFMPRLEAGGPRARAMLALLLTMSHRPTLVAKARELTAGIRAEADALTDRERCHLRAAEALCSARATAASAAMAEAVDQNPTDILALHVRYQSLFASGRIQEMVDLIPGVRPAWDDELPLASYLDGMEAFALEESERFEEAEELGRRGVEAEPSDLWAIHSIAHVMEMQQRREEGVAWLDQHRPVLGGAGFAGHLWWHQAIQLWALGRFPDVLQLFDDNVYPGDSSEGLDLSNATSLLARLESTDVDVGDRWARLADGAEARIGRHSHPFNDGHYVLALTRSGHLERARELVAGMRTWSQGDDDAAEILRRVGVTVGEAMLAYGSGDWATAAAGLEPVADQWWRLGGSQAQRFFYRTVLDDAQRRATAA